MLTDRSRAARFCSNPPSDRAWRAHAESAMRAVRKCDPLKVPAEYMPFFDQWKVETIHLIRERPRDDVRANSSAALLGRG